MKKILIVIGNMGVGGVQKSLLELLKELSGRPEYEVSLYCCKRQGAFLNRIPNRITILRENPYAAATEEPLCECKKRGLKYYIFRIVMSLWSKCFTKEFPASVLCKIIGKIDGQYDIAISYSQPIEDHSFCSFSNEIVLNCVEADEKITFLHCDFGSYGGNTKRNRNLYKKFDRIGAVSNSVGKRLAEIIPEVSEKIRTVYNFCDCREIERMADDKPVIYKKKSFITVARLSEEKGIIPCISIFDKLKKDGYDFEWHIVGGGSLRNAIEEEIARYTLQENIILEGEQLNPYRYIKNANYFLLPSLHEAAPMVFDEAFSLSVPILTTKTLSAVELVENRGIGIVCENNEQAIYDMLYYVLSENKELNIQERPNNEVCMKQFECLISEE